MKSEFYSVKLKVEEAAVEIPAVHSELPSELSSRPFVFSADPAVAALQARYKKRQREAQRHMAPTRLVPAPKIFVAAQRTDSAAQLRKKKSSEQLRASKTFAAFREYIEEYMIWVSIDESDPEDVAAYNKFIAEHSPAPTQTLSDESLEFLFRHIDPKPQDIDEESD
ncbi:hypothetical protein C8R43DRAFT_1143280 [Mycena crocata]|nr:hypothetical protein C8R43DRAFT_1143280 [Mycena crocata]